MTRDKASGARCLANALGPTCLALGVVLFGAVLCWAVAGVVRPTAVEAAQQAPAPNVYKSVYDGWKWWHVYCYRCHGTNAIATTMAPNLIDPNNQLTRSAFVQFVRQGVPDKGMQSWAQLLNAKQMGDLYLYVRARATKVLPPGRPDEVGPKGGAWVPPPGWTGR